MKEITYAERLAQTAAVGVRTLATREAHLTLELASVIRAAARVEFAPDRMSTADCMTLERFVDQA